MDIILVDCHCSLCHQDHIMEMTQDEFKTMADLPGALKAKRLQIACNVCRPFRYFGQEQRVKAPDRLFGNDPKKK